MASATATPFSWLDIVDLTTWPPVYNGAVHSCAVSSRRSTAPHVLPVLKRFRDGPVRIGLPRTLKLRQILEHFRCHFSFCRSLCRIDDHLLGKIPANSAVLGAHERNQSFLPVVTHSEDRPFALFGEPPHVHKNHRSTDDAMTAGMAHQKRIALISLMISAPAATASRAMTALVCRWK